MKKTRSNSRSNLPKMAGSVSAAALMLGVSHAATVGFNFQANYCSTPSYSGSVVTAPAFGVSSNRWESLTQMDNGYGPCSGPLDYTLTETIDTTTSTDGLNPLPSGSLNLTWSAATANVSGFAGYGKSFGGNGYHPGEQQVYWGFLRDGVNFGPGSSGADNNQIGYSIDITGLKSVFTNTPFVIQLIGSSDSMNAMTNAFIVDASLNNTQSVVYPSPQVYGNAGGASWFRAIGGGISTVSTSIDTDHIKIIGNRAAHGGDIGAGDDYDNASCISGFIITDKPVITMSPQPVMAGLHDNINLRVIAAGVPPLSYQWRKNGQPISGATTTSYSILNITNSESYDVVVTNLYGSAISSASTIGVEQIAIALDPDGSGNLDVSWNYDDATLQQATVVTGPYTDVPGNPVSPYVFSPDTTPLFFRYTRPAPTTPLTIDSNPYDM